MLKQRQVPLTLFAVMVCSVLLASCASARAPVGAARPTGALSATSAPAAPAPTQVHEATGGKQPTATLAPQQIATSAPASTPPRKGLTEQLAEIDDLLAQTVAGNLAYNRPAAMTLDETTRLQLLLSPSTSQEALKQRITEPGELVAAAVNITPRMRAELVSADPDAFIIQPYHPNAEQLISNLEPTEWLWTVTAKKEGTYKLRLALYRLVEYEGKEYWRVVKEYEDTIAINVTLGQRLARFDWYWLVGILLTGLALPGLFLWLQNRRTKRAAK